MRTVWKYTLVGPDITLRIPLWSFFLHGRILPNGNAELWFDVNDDSEPIEQRFLTLGTGREIPRDAEHVCSLVEPGDLIDFAWHIFQVEVTYDPSPNLD